METQVQKVQKRAIQLSGLVGRQAAQKHASGIMAGMRGVQRRIHAVQHTAVHDHKSNKKEEGSDMAATQHETAELRLSPSDVAINPVFAGLRSGRGEKEYIAGVASLALTMKQVGQKQAVLIRTNTTGSSESYELVAGHRRWDAAKLEGLELLCRFEELTDDEAMRAALVENFQREDFSEMDKARIILGLRVNMKMKTKAIAEYLGVSTATVTETERLLELPKDVQQRVENGELTKTAALAVAPVTEAARPTVIKEAQVEADKEKKGRVAEQKRKGKVVDPVEEAKPAKVETKHVRRAIRKTEGAVEKNRAPNRAEIVDMFVQLTGPAYPKGLVQVAGVWLAWIKGEVGDRQLKAAWDDVGDLIPSSKQQVSIPAAKVLERLEKQNAPNGENGKSAKKAVAKVPKVKAKAKGKAKVKAKAVPKSVKVKAKAVAKRKAA